MSRLGSVASSSSASHTVQNPASSSEGHPGAGLGTLGTPGLPLGASSIQPGATASLESTALGATEQQRAQQLRSRGGPTGPKGLKGKRGAGAAILPAVRQGWPLEFGAEEGEGGGSNLLTAVGPAANEKVGHLQGLCYCDLPQSQ